MSAIGDFAANPVSKPLLVLPGFHHFKVRILPPQAVPRSEKPVRIVAERPAIGGLLQFGARSPGSGSAIFEANSPKVSGHYRQDSRFRGDRRRRPGSNRTARGRPESNFVIPDELGQSGAQLLFHLISRLYERTSMRPGSGAITGAPMFDPSSIPVDGSGQPCEARSSVPREVTASDVALDALRDSGIDSFRPIVQELTANYGFCDFVP
jgi:hypothetical protein